MDKTWTPPLADDLFGAGVYSEPFYPLLNPYPGAQTIQDLMYQDSQMPEFLLEKALRRYAEHSVYKNRFKEVPAYLRDRIYSTERLWARALPHYTQLVSQLVAESEHQVAFITLNYDTFLEQALRRVRPDLEILGIDDYIRDGRPAWVFKVHGSIDWTTPIGASGQDWHEALRTVQYPEILKQEIYVGQIKIHSIAQHRGSDGIPVHPLLTAPLAGKGESEFLLRSQHEAALIEFLATCRKFLILGTSGRDDDLLRFLAAHAATPDVVDYVGVESEKDVSRVRNRFERIVTNFLYARAEDNSGLHWDGFGPYINQGRLQEFAET